METIKENKLEVLLLVLILVVIAGGYYFYELYNYQQHLVNAAVSQKTSDPIADTSYVTDIGAETGSIYILLLGIDKTEERESWLGLYRSDAISIVKIDLDNKSAKILSIPRDTYTYVPVEGKYDKINHAYAYGSLQSKEEAVQATIAAVNNLLNKPIINYYFLMDMEPIPRIVDDIGGVELDVEIDMKDHDADLSKGLQVLNGRQAYDYVHWRYSAGGDIDRIKRQQKFVRTLLKQQRDSGKILETARIILKYRKDFETDLSVAKFIGVAKFIAEIPQGNVTYDFLPGRGQTIDGISYWVLDTSQTDNIIEDFINS